MIAAAAVGLTLMAAAMAIVHATTPVLNPTPLAAVVTFASLDTHPEKGHFTLHIQAKLANGWLVAVRARPQQPPRIDAPIVVHEWTYWPWGTVYSWDGQ